MPYRCQVLKVLIVTLLVLFALYYFIPIQNASNSCTLKDLQDGTDSARDQICKDQIYEHFSLRPKEQGEIHCSKIIHGDAETVKKALEIRESIKNSRFQLNEKMYLNLTKNCEHFRKFRKYITIPLSKEEENFPIAYSMVIHDQIEMFERLLRAVYAPQNIYCVHIDKKSPEEFKDAVRSIASCFDNVFVASKLVQVVYASWSRVEADFNCMTDLLQSNVRWKYLLNTCGTDFPLKTNAEIVRGLKVLNGRNSMESEKPASFKLGRWKHHYEVTDAIRETKEEKTPPPNNILLFTGNAYIVVCREFVEYIFKEPKVPKIQKFIDWIKDTYTPDELFWSTLTRMQDVPGSTPFSDKFQLSDMNAMARMIKWDSTAGDLEKGASYPACTGVYRRYACVYGSGDLSWMVKQHHFLANKFDPNVDNIAINCMEEFLRYKTIYRDEF